MSHILLNVQSMQSRSSQSSRNAINQEFFGPDTYGIPTNYVILTAKWHTDTVSSGVEEQKFKASPPVLSLKVPPAFKRDDTIMKKAVSKVSRRSIPATAFSVGDLQEATNSFSQANLLGECGLGSVYRAELPDGQVLAVKKLDMDASAPIIQNEDDFLRVIDGLAKLQHANCEELVGYCTEHGQRLLVYEYFSQGTVNELLHGEGSVDYTKGLSWNMRVKITLGAARALEYVSSYYHLSQLDVPCLKWCLVVMADS